MLPGFDAYAAVDTALITAALVTYIAFRSLEPGSLIARYGLVVIGVALFLKCLLAN